MVDRLDKMDIMDIVVFVDIGNRVDLDPVGPCKGKGDEVAYLNLVDNVHKWTC